MLTQELLVEIHVLHRQGRSIRQIAKTLRISRNTVCRYLRVVAKTPVYHRAKRISKLEPSLNYFYFSWLLRWRTGLCRSF